MIFTQLILAHLLGDFLFQPNSWVADKEKKKGRSIYLYIHTLIHFLLTLLVLWNLDLVWMAAVIAITHFFIDFAKLHFQNLKTKRLWFFADQLMHIIVLVLMSVLYFPVFLWSDIFSDVHLKILTGVLFLTMPCSIIIKTIITAWTPNPTEKTNIGTDSLANAGKYIGILERLLVFVFILVDHWEGVGFMIAAKSVFRFSDLAEAKQRKLTEYVLIGTLLSFGIAVITGIIVKIQ